VTEREDWQPWDSWWDALRVAQEELEADEDFAGVIPEPVSRYGIEEEESHVYANELDYIVQEGWAMILERTDTSVDDLVEFVDDNPELGSSSEGARMKQYIDQHDLTVHVTCSECGEAIT
jgi:hypothetical protein